MPNWGYCSISPDERWLVYGQQDGTLTDLMLVEKTPLMLLGLVGMPVRLVVLP